jgi:hypothetical protein
VAEAPNAVINGLIVPQRKDEGDKERDAIAGMDGEVENRHVANYSLSNSTTSIYTASTDHPKQE